jgi:WD40 repeat protein
VAFNSDGSRLATAHEDGAARIWSLANLAGTQQPAPTHTLAGHIGSAWDAAFNPAGDLLATLGFDGAVRLWDAATGEELLAIPGENNGPDLGFSPDGRSLAVTSGSGKVIVYAVHLDDLLALARSRLTRSLTPAECQRYFRMADCPG